MDFCTGRPQVKEGHPSTSSWYLFSNASLAPGSWPSNPCLGHFCLSLPLILCKSCYKPPHHPFVNFYNIFLSRQAALKRNFLDGFFSERRSKKHVNVNEANLITVWKVHLGTVRGCSYPAVSCTDRGKSYVFTEGEKYLAASNAFSRLLGI